MSERRWVFGAVAAAVVVAGAAWYGSRPAGGDMPAAVANAASAVEPPRANYAEAPPPPVIETAPAPAPAPTRVAVPVPVGRFQLLRVAIPDAAAGQTATAAAATISVDGLPAKVYRVGDAVVGAVTLQAVQPTTATLGPVGGPAAVVLTLTPPGTPLRTVSGSDTPPVVVRAASAPPVNRTPVPVSDPNHGEDTSNR